MRVFALLACLLIALPDRPDPTKREVRSTQEQLIGQWRPVHRLVEGNVDNRPDDAAVMTITKTEILVRENGQERGVDDCTYRLDDTKTPIQIDIIPKRDQKKIEAILRIDGDILTLCFVFGGEGPRPTEFASKPGTRVALMKMVRIKK